MAHLFGTEAAPSPTPPFDEQHVFWPLFSALSDGIVVATMDGDIVMANPAASRILGYTLDELTRLNVDDLVPDAIGYRHGAYRRSCEGNPRPRSMGAHMELVAKRADGAEVIVEMALSPLQGRGNKYLVVGIRDIAAYPRMQQALRRARYSEHLAQWERTALDEREIQRLIEQIPQTAIDALQIDCAELILLEPARQTLRLKASAGPWHRGQEFSELTNDPLTLHGHVLTQTSPVIMTDLGAKQRFTIPCDYLSSGFVSALMVPVMGCKQAVGTLAVCAKAAFPFGDDEVRFLTSLSNVLATAMQRAHCDETIHHAQRLECIGKLISGISHDFNNFITVIQGNLQVLGDIPDLAITDAARESIASASKASQRAAELVARLQGLSRRQVLKPAAIDVGAMLCSLAEMLRRTLDQRIVIRVDAQPDCPPVKADPSQLESALLNIAINARDAMPNGGRLSFSSSACPTLPAQAFSTLDDVEFTETGYVAIGISDTGNGMSDAVRERAFEPFFTTKDVDQGTGLGLSSVYGFVKQSKGAIGIQTAPGQGCSLTLYLPCWSMMAQMHATRAGGA